MMTVFSLRYAVAVTLVFHHDWAAHAGFSLPIAMSTVSSRACSPPAHCGS
jgi:hypothetical protein